MITLRDCIDLCGLDENEVAAISEHEHVPEIAATALASYLLHQPHGSEAIRSMIIDDIHKALDDGRVKHAAELFGALSTLPARPSGRARRIGCGLNRARYLIHSGAPRSDKAWRHAETPIRSHNIE